MRAILVIGAHFDDAVLSAGQFLAGRTDATVSTVFGGMPDTKAVLTAYDQKCGFTSAQEAVKARRQEDRDALSLLACRPRHLPFIDSQYGYKADHNLMVKLIKELIEELDPEFVVGPLGLVHPDHELVRDALLDAATSDLAVPVWLYEDLPSRVTHPESVQSAIRVVEARDDVDKLELGFCGTGPLDKKMSALWQYRSQMILPEFENPHVLLVPERFWLVGRR